MDLWNEYGPSEPNTFTDFQLSILLFSISIFSILFFMDLLNEDGPFGIYHYLSEAIYYFVEAATQRYSTE